jgi:hypothetical protein
LTVAITSPDGGEPGLQAATPNAKAQTKAPRASGRVQPLAEVESDCGDSGRLTKGRRTCSPCFDNRSAAVASGAAVKTIYDLIAVGMFAGLAILFLQRSAAETRDPLPIWKYGVPAIGCALADYLGDHNQMIAAVVLFVAVAAYSVMTLRPFHRGPST